MDAMGYEGKFYYGTAGATATNLVENVVDLTYDKDTERGSTTIRGDGTKPPIVTSRVTGLKPTITWTMLNRTADTQLAAFRAAAATGAAVAVRTKDHASGKGFDGDVTLTEKEGQPLHGEQTFEFTAEATREFRQPQLYI
ncbi:MAG: hypothetical protein L0211_24415 [Planctomycetaceae bacterium]|nr:hypothetical protein [Planctomycetaceae bacterium]